MYVFRIFIKTSTVLGTYFKEFLLKVNFVLASDQHLIHQKVSRSVHVTNVEMKYE